MKREVTAREKAQNLAFLGLLLTIALVAAPLAWFLCPFGPGAHSLTLKWVATGVLFAGLTLGLFVVAAMMDRLDEWMRNAQDWLEGRLLQAEQRRLARRRPAA